MEKRKRNDQHHHQQEQDEKYILLLLKPDIWYLKWYEKKVEENDSSWNWIGR